MSLSELWSLYGQNYIDALLATWGMTLESFAIAMVLAAGGLDPEKLCGFAFGIGLERIVMRRFAVDDMRLFYENDTRFLEQF